MKLSLVDALLLSLSMLYLAFRIFRILYQCFCRFGHCLFAIGYRIKLTDQMHGRLTIYGDSVAIVMYILCAYLIKQKWCSRLTLV